MWLLSVRGGTFEGKGLVLMKILHVVPTFGLGGMEKVICALINGLPQELHHEILVLDSSHEAKQWLQNQNVHFVDFVRPAGTISYLVDLFQVLKRELPDVLMTYNWGATDAIWLARLVGIATIFHNEHGFNLDEAQHTMWKRNIIRFIVYRLVKKVIVVSQALHVSLKNSYRLGEQQVAFIPNGIDSTFYSPDPVERSRIRQELGLKEDDFVIGFSGRLDPVKNFELMLQIFELCAKKDGRIRLMLIGDGPEKERIKIISQQKGFEEKILCIGQTDAVLPYLRALDVFLLTSFREQMPMSILEAMSVGVPVVATRVGEISYMVEDGKEGFLCDLEDSFQKWARQILCLRDLQLRQVMGIAARNSVIEGYQGQVMVAKYNCLLSNELPRP